MHEEHAGCSCHESREHATKRDWIRILVGGLIFGCGIIMAVLEINTYISFAVYLAAYLILGAGVLKNAAQNIIKGRVFDENFLMCLATIGAFIIGEYPEAVAVMLFYQIGEYFQDVAVRKSRKSISNLMNIRPDYANLKTGDEIIKVSPETVKPGDIIIVKPGEKIPLDGEIISGDSTLDTAALTGESLPRVVKSGDTALSGSVSNSGLLTVRVSKEYGESTVARIIDLVENAASKKAPAENFITKFAKYYTPAIVFLAALLALVPPLITNGDWGEWLHRGLVFMVISCPCALVISIPLSFFGGIGAASRKGILIKGSNFLDALNNLDIIIFDKTGTLTKGIFEVSGIHAAEGFSEAEVLRFAAGAEKYSTHPISQSILKACTDAPNTVSHYEEKAGMGISVRVDGKGVLAGSVKLMKEKGITIEDVGAAVHVAVDGVYAGYIVVEDSIRPDSENAVQRLKSMNVSKTIMLTGDSVQTARTVAEKLGLDEFHARLLPHEKVERLESIYRSKRRGGSLAFVGDGINDAPVLTRADIGIAMGGLGSDAAIEAADVVLMTDEPSKVADAVDIARRTRRIVWQNIVFALGIKAAMLALGAFGVATMWEAVFADVGVSLLAVLNALRVNK